MTKLTLLTSKGTMHHVGGLNWGSNKKNHTRKLDAYIPIHLKTIRNNIGFFSPKKNPNLPIKIIWDDGVIMNCKFEGTSFNRIDKKNYPKQISSYPHKDQLGKYFRKRLGVKGGRRINIQDLMAYGRTDIDLTFDSSKNVYIADFSI